MSTINHERARIASLSRSRQSDDPELIEARRNLVALRLEQQVREAITAGPPLTDVQRDRIVELLRSGVAS